jgi:hypothetical protein
MFSIKRGKGALVDVGAEFPSRYWNVAYDRPFPTG